MDDLLAGVLGNLMELTKGKPLVVLASVRADAAPAHAAFQRLGFFPTAYFPGLIAAPEGRGDVVQYTRLIGRSLRDSTCGVTAFDWPEARTVIEQVAQFDAESTRARP